MTEFTTAATPVIVDHGDSITFTIRTSLTGTVQVWGTVIGMEYTAENRELRRVSVSADRVYDGRLRETMTQMDAWLAEAEKVKGIVSEVRASTLRAVMRLLTSIQPVDQPQADYTAAATADKTAVDPGPA